MQKITVSLDSYDWDDVAEWLFLIALDGSKIHKEDLDEHTDQTMEAMAEAVKDLVSDYKKTIKKDKSNA